MLYTRGGPEIGVAATKTYVSQVIAMTLFALYLARVRGTADDRAPRARSPTARDSCRRPSTSCSTRPTRFVRSRAQLRKAQSVLFIGRYVNFPTALEGALKLKEISYIHAEGYPAGEMKHGPIALLDSTVPVVGIVTDDRVREKMLSNLDGIEGARSAGNRRRQPRRRGGRRASPTTSSGCRRSTSCSRRSSTSSRLQLLAYHIADIEGKDVDQPRNLAKTVTVE